MSEMVCSALMILLSYFYQINISLYIFILVIILLMQYSRETETKQSSHIDAFDYESNQNQSLKNRPLYGNLIVLYKSKFLFLSLGPDYPCFVFAFIFFCLLCVLCAFFIPQDSVKTRVSVIIGGIMQMIIYVIVVLSDPGITTVQDMDSKQNNEDIKRYCKKCKIQMVSKMRHCRFCQVCIKGYDHHCPWTSKCIGENNLWRFRIFVMYSICYLIFCTIVVSLI